MNIKFTNNPHWQQIISIIPDAKVSLKVIVQNLNTNKFSAYISKQSKCQYHLKAKEKIVLSITVIKNSDIPCLHLSFKNNLEDLYVYNIEQFNTAINTWYEKFINSPIEKKSSNYIRKAIYSIEDVLSKRNELSHDKDSVIFDGDMIHMNSGRYHTFVNSGTKCVCCGLEGTYFAKERNWKTLRWHFNLYGINENGEEIMLTKDHIIPRSKGGENHILNYQTMCSVCNSKKGNNMEGEENESI